MSDSFSDYYNAYLTFKLVEDLDRINKREKQRKKLLARSDELQRIGHALIEEHNRLSEIGDIDGISKLEKQIAEVSEQIDELSAEFDKYYNEG